MARLGNQTVTEIRLETGEVIPGSRRSYLPSLTWLADRRRASRACASFHLAFLLSGLAGRATPHGSYLSLGSGIRSSAAL